MEHTRMVTDWRQMRTVVNEEIEINGYVLPVGRVLCICPRMVGMTSENFDDPQNYNPHRFMNGLPKASDYKFLSFSAGKHKCLGMPMAQMECQVTIAALLRTYDLEIVAGPDGSLMPELDCTSGSLAPAKRM
eukprot:TRINITY_DN15092_c0_g1_i1.p1 TRINITY_DN15092_c0_g1~~TRINITY_DN15092_c0_g1_i1.p1  ORF type:complete len:132 (-),score=25.99 TRINITY_DN15092_c0_g1_i1:241-636(-)